MGTIKEKLQYTLDARKNVQRSLTEKGVECENVPFGEYAELIDQIGGGDNTPDDTNITDILNHGSTVGLSTYYAPYTQGTSMSMIFVSGYISWSLANYGSLLQLTYPIIKDKYRFLYIDMESTYGVSGSGHYCMFNVRAFDSRINGTTIQGFEIAKIIDYTTQTNYANSTPWYTLPRQVIKIDLFQALQNYNHDFFFLGFYKYENEGKIYRIWLSNNDNDS